MSTNQSKFLLVTTLCQQSGNTTFQYYTVLGHEGGKACQRGSRNTWISSTSIFYCQTFNFNVVNNSNIEIQDESMMLNEFSRSHTLQKRTYPLHWCSLSSWRTPHWPCPTPSRSSAAFPIDSGASCLSTGPTPWLNWSPGQTESNTSSWFSLVVWGVNHRNKIQVKTVKSIGVTEHSLLLD